MIWALHHSAEVVSSILSLVVSTVRQFLASKHVLVLSHWFPVLCQVSSCETMSILSMSMSSVLVLVSVSLELVPHEVPHKPLPPA